MSDSKTKKLWEGRVARSNKLVSPINDAKEIWDFIDAVSAMPKPVGHAQYSLVVSDEKQITKRDDDDEVLVYAWNEPDEWAASILFHQTMDANGIDKNDVKSTFKAFDSAEHDARCKFYVRSANVMWAAQQTVMTVYMSVPRDSCHRSEIS